MIGNPKRIMAAYRWAEHYSDRPCKWTYERMMAVTVEHKAYEALMEKVVWMMDEEER